MTPEEARKFAEWHRAYEDTFEDMDRIVQRVMGHEDEDEITETVAKHFVSDMVQGVFANQGVLANQGQEVAIGQWLEFWTDRVLKTPDDERSGQTFLTVVEAFLVGVEYGREHPREPEEGA